MREKRGRELEVGDNKSNEGQIPIGDLSERRDEGRELGKRRKGEGRRARGEGKGKER